MTEKQLTKEWIEYDGDYCKAMQDVKTKDGKEYLMCWPNAGKWHVLSSGSKKYIPDNEITHVRKTHNKDW
jgi:hypothetical protein